MNTENTTEKQELQEIEVEVKELDTKTEAPVKKSTKLITINSDALKEKFARFPKQQLSAARLIASFFVLMLLFTILSRAADSLTIPDVTVTNPESASLEYKVVAGGTIMAAAEVPLTADAGFMVNKVHVQEGQAIEEGDPILTLSLDDVEEQLDKLKTELRQSELQESLNNMGGGSNSDEDNLKAAELAWTRAQEDYEQTLKDSEIPVNEARKALQTAQNQKRRLENSGDWILATPGNGTPSEYNAENLEDMGASDELVAAQQAVDEAQDALKKALEDQERTLQQAERSIEDAEIAREQALKQIEQAQSQAAIDRAKEGIQNEISAMSLQEKRDEIKKLEELVESGGIVPAPVSGYMGKVDLSTGMTTSGGSFGVITTVEEGLRFQAEITKEEADHIERGVSGELELSGQGSSGRISNVVVDSIVSSENSGQMKITCSLPEGKGEPGITGTLTLVQHSTTYSTCVPLSAIRSENNQKYVLVIRERDGILGTETVAERMPVTIKGQDNTVAAVDGGLSRSDEVIIQSEKQISEGDRVRIKSS